MQFVAFMKEDGTPIPMYPDDFLVFVDETGDRRLKNPSYQVFGLGGCATLAKYYNSNIVNPWESMKEKHFGDKHTPLHASRLPKLTYTQMDAFGQFFSGNEFCRIAVCLNNCTSFKQAPNIGIYQIVSRWLLQGIENTARHFNIGRIFLVIEESKKGDKLASQFINGYSFIRSQNGTDSKIPFFKYRMPKKEGEAALEIADFVIHTAGNQVRRGLEASVPRRKDFSAVFESVDERLISFLEITKVVKN
jgi:hypothetical protein